MLPFRSLFGTDSSARHRARRAFIRVTLATALVPGAVGFATSAGAAEPVRVLYAGSLVNLMEHSVGPAFTKATGIPFEGYAGGSNKVANEIKGKLRRGDIFISASPKVNDSLIGSANGDWVKWYATFAESPLVIGYNPSSRFAASLKRLRWDAALSQPGIRIGRTDPKLDPKGRFTVDFVTHAAQVYQQPDLVQKVLGDEENPSQVLPEETLVGRLQSGQLDAGFFYSTETSDLKIPAIALPEDLREKAQYTLTILTQAPNATGAARFVAFLFSREGQRLLKAHGIDTIAPKLTGDAATVPASLKTTLTPAQ